MKQLEILSALTRWAKATPDEILDSPAFAMPCRIGEEQALLRPAAVEPAASCSLALSVTFGDEPHELRFSRSSRFPELDKIWDSRAEIPEPILLALVEKDCGPVFQMLENAVRKQLKLVGTRDAPGAETEQALLSLEVDDSATPPEGRLRISLTRSASVVSAFGALRNLDLSHEAVRAQTLSAECEYAAFAQSDADLAALAPGDIVLLPEIGSIPPRLIVDGRFVQDATGTVPYVRDALVHVRDAAAGRVSLGEVFDAVDSPHAPQPAGSGAQLKLVKGGRTVASGRLDSLAGQPAFVVEG